MKYTDMANARHLLELLVSRDAEILDGLMDEYGGCVNALVESVWNHGIYEVATQAMQSREAEKTQDIPGFEGTMDALEQLSHCYKTGDDL